MNRERKSPAHVGIETRHKKACGSHAGGKCDCKPSYRAEVHDPTTHRPAKSPWFHELADARAWRIRAQAAVHDGSFHAGTHITVQEACESWLAKAEAGAVQNKSGDPYKPSVIRSYETSLRLHVLPEIGSKKLHRVRRSELQALVDRLQLTRSPSTVRNAVMPLRAVYRRAVLLDLVASNPTIGLALPSVTGSRHRVASPDEAAALLRALPEMDRAPWATAMYAGLRLGELRALEWEAVELERGLIRVEFNWDPKKGKVRPKSRSGQRTVAIPGVLRAYLEAHENISGRRSGRVFGRSVTQPFCDSSLRERAKRIWTSESMNHIGFHEARHTYATLMIAAGVNAKTLSTMMGHKSISITLDRYGHLFPGAESEAGASLDAYLQAV